MTDNKTTIVTTERKIGNKSVFDSGHVDRVSAVYKNRAIQEEPKFPGKIQSLLSRQKIASAVKST